MSLLRRQRSYYRIYERAFRQAFAAQFRPVKEALLDGRDSPENRVVALPIEQAFLQIYRQVGVAFAAYQYEQLTSAKKNTPFIRYKRDAPAEATTLWQRLFRQYVLNEGATRIAAITATTRNLITSILAEAAQEGYSIDRTASYLQARYTKLSAVRARVIARTEILSASNHGALLGAQATGIPLLKTWLSAKDSRTRDPHRAANGQTVGLDDFFSVNGENMQHPGDPNGSAANTVNCRCSVIFRPA